MKVGIVFVPFITNNEHLRYSQETIESLQCSTHELIKIAVINQAHSQYRMWIDDNFNYIMLNEKNNLSRAWNKGITQALNLGCTYVICPNLDIIFNVDTVKNLIAFADTHSEALMWTASEWDDKDTIATATGDDSYDEHPHFSLFMVDKRLFSKVGEFDEIFEPAYNEDNDMHYRIKLSGNLALKTGSSKFYHYGSRTIKSDIALERRNAATHAMNNQRYMAKWGGMPHDEKFDYPYNNPEYNWTYTSN